MLTHDDLQTPYAPYRDRVTADLMERAVFEGFTAKSLRGSLRANGLPEQQDILLFPDGILDVLSWHSLRADERLRTEIDRDMLLSLRIRERIETLVMHRLQTALPEREAIRRALVILSMPLNLKRNLWLLHQTVDTIWQLAGDTSTDTNYYTKRMTLAAVYGATLPIWLTDYSDDLQDTRAFLKRRIENALSLGKLPSVLPHLEKGLLKFGELAGKIRYGR